LGAALALTGAAARAEPPSQDKDLDLIPSTPAAPPPAADAHPTDTLYLEDALSDSASRHGLLVLPPPGPHSDWIERLFLDTRSVRQLTPRLTLNLSARANLRVADDVPLGSHEGARLDLREAYLSWSPADGRYLDVGRINLKSGVALGFNPTDFFKTRAVVEVLSSDPSALREDRLGAVMLRGQVLREGLSLTLAYAPRLARRTALYSDVGLPTLDPSLDRTNASDRVLVKATAALTPDLSPEALLYVEHGRARLGLNLTYAVGRSSVIYAEWAGGRRRSLVAEALAYGRATGSIPVTAPDALPADPRARFASDLALGASYTTASKIVLNLEYHLREGGFTGATWRQWFASGAARKADPRVAAQLWYLRAYAADQQTPISRQQLFLRADRQDALVRNLELSGYVVFDLEARSALAQAAADYHLSDTLTLGALVSLTAGGRRSDFGSVPGAASALIKLARYF
jgi:hypothetical protein